MVGFVLPFWIVVGSFAAAFLVNILINPVLYAYDVLHTWEPGMSAIPTQIAQFLRLLAQFLHWRCSPRGRDGVCHGGQDPVDSARG